MVIIFSPITGKVVLYQSKLQVINFADFGKKKPVRSTYVTSHKVYSYKMLDFYNKP